MNPLHTSDGRMIDCLEAEKLGQSRTFYANGIPSRDYICPRCKVKRRLEALVDTPTTPYPNRMDDVVEQLKTLRERCNHMAGAPVFGNPENLEKAKAMATQDTLRFMVAQIDAILENK